MNRFISQRTLCTACVFFATAIFHASTAAVAGTTGSTFVKIDEINLPTNTGGGLCTGCSNHHGLANVNNEWHIANPFSNNWRSYDNSFHLLRTTAIPGLSSVPGATDLRGLAADPFSGHLFLNDINTGIVYEMTTGGSIAQQFNTIPGGGLNALAFDRRDSTLWLLQSGLGTVEHRTKTGALISSLALGGGWTGLAIDTRNSSLLLLQSDADTVDEYSTAGVFLGQPLATDQLPANGQGLFYISDLGRLYATSQQGVVSVFSDPTRVPEPATAHLLLLCLAGGCGTISTRRCRR